MNGKEIKSRLLNMTTLKIIGVFVILFAALMLLWYGNATSNQAQPALLAQVYFDGEYRIGDGPWQKIVVGKHISSTKGDVTLRGNFHMLTPFGEYIGLYDGDLPIAIYTDHVSVTLYEENCDPYVLDMENPWFGDSVCGKGWTAYSLMNNSGAPLEILIHNPHIFGNENAVDELLSNVRLWSGLEFEKSVLQSGEDQREMGLFFMMVSLVLFGIALFSTLIHIKNSRRLWIFGVAILFAGSYFTYSANGVSIWNDSIVSNTTMLGCSMILYMLFLSMGIVHFMDVGKKLGNIVIICLGMVDALLFVIPMVTDLRFYDTWFYWGVAQVIVNLVLLICLAKEYNSKKNQKGHLYIGAALPLIAFEIDMVMIGLGIWKDGILSEWVFTALFAGTMVVVLRSIPSSINAAEKAKELELQRSRLEAEKNIMEAQLKDSRISLMLSQIQPHFIYNTLGTIERMCLKDPEKAFHLVRNFSLYLRGNFSELDSVSPIRFVEEL